MITQPEEVLTAEKKLEELHNQMLVLDQNYARVKGLKESEESQIAELQNIKATLTESNNALESKIKEHTAEIAKLEEEAYIVKRETEEAKRGFSQVNEDLDKIRMDIEAKRGEFYAKETDLKNKESELSIREENLKALESELSRKSDRIKLFKESL